ncbi:MAG: phosphate ABC transporter, permease protein PstA, partial [Acidobacteria bacterium]|nr:phosphate ABC transporter, permease protein PstA [Acidobacteriota bacterium]
MTSTGRKLIEDRLLRWSGILMLLLALAALAALLFDVFHDGWGRLSWAFLTGFPSRFAENAGIWHALVG